MSKRMLVDGAHPEEIRVVVTSGNRLDEYDIETSFKKQVKGNIYLKKHAVEPSLQAAVDFGAIVMVSWPSVNHPDYYQIPMEDRQALIDEQEELEAARAAREHRKISRRHRRGRRQRRRFRRRRQRRWRERAGWSRRRRPGRRPTTKAPPSKWKMATTPKKQIPHPMTAPMAAIQKCGRHR